LQAVHGHDALVVPRAFRQIGFVRRLHFYALFYVKTSLKKIPLLFAEPPHFYAFVAQSLH
jgi:hypothetical protein